jgi:hypothetical protein
MSEEHDGRDESLRWAPIDRREMLRRLVVGSAFAVPVVSSFSMQSLSMNMAAAQSNQTSP